MPLHPTDIQVCPGCGIGLDVSKEDHTFTDRNGGVWHALCASNTLAYALKQNCCHSCEKVWLKYADGLCESCHQFAIAYTDGKIDAYGKPIKS